MPLYDYKCRICGKEFEFLVLKTTVAACPACGSRKLEQLLVTRFAVSSTGIRQSNLDKAQRALKNSNDVRDKKMAQLDKMREHEPSPMLFPKKKKK